MICNTHRRVSYVGMDVAGRQASPLTSPEHSIRTRMSDQSTSFLGEAFSKAKTYRKSYDLCGIQSGGQPGDDMAHPRVSYSRQVWVLSASKHPPLTSTDLQQRLHHAAGRPGGSYRFFFFSFTGTMSVWFSCVCRHRIGLRFRLSILYVSMWFSCVGIGRVLRRQRHEAVFGIFFFFGLTGFLNPQSSEFRSCDAIFFVNSAYIGQWECSPGIIRSTFAFLQKYCFDLLLVQTFSSECFESQKNKIVLLYHSMRHPIYIDLILRLSVVYRGFCCFFSFTGISF